MLQLAANLLNAKKSTGPNTTNGTARSKLNAVKHGLSAQTVLLPNEDALAYKALCQKYSAHYRPADFAEETLVQQIADTVWRLGRCFALSENVFSTGHMGADGNLLMPDPALHAAVTAPRVLKNNIPSLEAVSRATSRLERGLEKVMVRLDLIQERRQAREKEALEIAAATRKHFNTIHKPFIPVELGFVLTIEKIDAHIQRQSFIQAALEAFPLRPPSIAAPPRERFLTYKRLPGCYFTAMVGPIKLVKLAFPLPSVIEIGTAMPGATPVGISRFNWHNPATDPGAPPMYCTSAGTPPMDAVTGSSGTGPSGPGSIRPSIPAGFVWPSPVR